MNKLLLAGATIVAIALNPAVAFGGCDECQASTDVFFGHLRDHYGVRYQQALLRFNVCPFLKDRDRKDCDRHVDKYWPGINHVLFDKSMVGPFCDIATGLNCTKSFGSVGESLRDWQECDDCMLEIAQYGAVFIYPEDEIGIEHMLKNEGYCLNQQLPFDTDERQECQKFLTGFIAPAMQTFYNGFTQGSQDICHFWYGVCPGA